MAPAEEALHAIEQPNSLFWNPPPLQELMADVAPLDPDEHFDIPDLTEEEWGDVRGGAGAVTGTVLVDTNVFTARWLIGSSSG